MSVNIIEKIRLSYRSWVVSLAEILSAYTGKKRNWQLLAYMTEDGYEIYRKGRRTVEKLGVFNNSTSPKEIKGLKKKIKTAGGGREKQVNLRLSPVSVLQKSIKLPSGANDVIELVIKNQMRRLVPWSENDTCFSYKVDDISSASEEMDVTVVAVSKSIIRSSVEELAIINMNPGFVDYGESPHNDEALELFSFENNNVENNIKVINSSLLAACIICIGICSAGVLQLLEKLHISQQNIKKLKNARIVNAQLEKRNLNNLQRAKLQKFLILRKKDIVPRLVILEDLSKTVPDNAWLQKLEINDRNVLISGKARNATGLVQVLEASPMIEKVRFSAPVNRVGITEIETFSIVANMKAYAIVNEAR